MESKCKTSMIRMAPIKLRRMANFVRGYDVNYVVDQLKHRSCKASGIVLKSLDSAIANADNKGLDIDELKVKEIFVNCGPTLRRFKARAKGRAARILKRTSHLTIILSETN